MAKGRATFYLGEELLARVTGEALQLGRTNSEIVRRCITLYFSQHHSSDLEKEVGDRAVRKRTRELLKDRPLDSHDGIMLAVRVKDVINKEIKELKKCDWLTPSDYDRFIKLADDNKKVAATYEESDWLCEKLDILIDQLKQGKKELEAQEVINRLVRRQPAGTLKEQRGTYKSKK